LFSCFISASSLRVTQEHPFLVNNSWIPVKNLSIGDILTGVSGKFIITNITEVLGNVTVYNMKVNGLEDYFAGGVLVHNKAMKAKPPFFTEEVLEDPVVQIESPLLAVWKDGAPLFKPVKLIRGSSRINQAKLYKILHDEEYQTDIGAVKNTFRFEEGKPIPDLAEELSKDNSNLRPLIFVEYLDKNNKIEYIVSASVPRKNSLLYNAIKNGELTLPGNEIHHSDLVPPGQEILGAGMIILNPRSSKILVLSDQSGSYAPLGNQQLLDLYNSVVIPRFTEYAEVRGFEFFGGSKDTVITLLPFPKGSFSEQVSLHDFSNIMTVFPAIVEDFSMQNVFLESTAYKIYFTSGNNMQMIKYQASYAYASLLLSRAKGFESGFTPEQVETLQIFVDNLRAQVIQNGHLPLYNGQPVKDLYYPTE